MANLPGQILGELQEIGENVVRETTKVPGEIAGAALETLGTKSSAQKGQAAQVGKLKSPETPDAWDKIEGAGDSEIKKRIAREALAALTQRTRSNEPSVWERQQQEEAERKSKALEEKAKTSARVLPATGQKRPRGDLYGVKAKQASAEMSRNVRQD